MSLNADYGLFCRAARAVVKLPGAIRLCLGGINGLRGVDYGAIIRCLGRVRSAAYSRHFTMQNLRQERERGGRGTQYLQQERYWGGTGGTGGVGVQEVKDVQEVQEVHEERSS